MQFLIVIVVLLALMWLFLVRPQKRRQLQQAQLIAALREGDEVLTAGGIYGVVRGLEEDSIVLEVAPGTNVRVARRAIAGKIEPDEPEDEPLEQEPGDEEAPAAEPASAEPNRR